MNLFSFLDNSSLSLNDPDFVNFANEDGQLLEKSDSSQRIQRRGSHIIQLTLLGTVLWKIVLFIMALFFMAATYVQHNDPDPFLWMPAYLVPFVINCILIVSIPEEYQSRGITPSKSTSCWSWIMNWKHLNQIISVHIVYCYILGIWTLVNFSYNHIHGHTGKSSSFLGFPSKEEDMLVEEAKELLGLCLAIAWLSFVHNGSCFRFGSKGISFGVTLSGIPILAWIVVEQVEKSETCF